MNSDALLDSSDQKCPKPRPPMLSLPTVPLVSIPQAPIYGRVLEESRSGDTFGVAARRGRRRTNREDMFIALPFVSGNRTSEPISLFGIFDGHGGQRASVYTSQRIPQLLLSRQDLSPTTASKLLRDAFLKIDSEFLSGGKDQPSGGAKSDMGFRTRSGSHFAAVALQNTLSRAASLDLPRPSRASTLRTARESSPAEPLSGHQAFHFSVPSSKMKNCARADDHISSTSARSQSNCGTTATVALIVGSELFLAHVGDSRAVLCTRNTAERLCEDHRPCREDEVERIESAGGLILTVAGTSRVNGVLAVSRAIGDKELKEYVIADPEISSRRLGEDDDFLIVASDGLWDVVDDQECVDIARCMRKQGDSLESISKRLICIAFERGSKDDISAIIICLKEHRRLLAERMREISTLSGEVSSHIVEVSIGDMSQTDPVGFSNCSHLNPAPTPRGAVPSLW